VGGRNGDETLASNEEYHPTNDLGPASSPWRQRARLPEARWSLGVTSIADIILVIGGEGKAQAHPALQYYPNQDTWYSFDISESESWTGFSLTTFGTQLYALGGKQNGVLTSTTSVYQVVFTNLMPIIQQ